MKLPLMISLALTVLILISCGQSQDEEFMAQLSTWIDDNLIMVLLDDDTYAAAVDELGAFSPTSKYDEDYQRLLKAHQRVVHARSQVGNSGASVELSSARDAASFERGFWLMTIIIENNR